MRSDILRAGFVQPASPSLNQDRTTGRSCRPALTVDFDRAVGQPRTTNASAGDEASVRADSSVDAAVILVRHEDEDFHLFLDSGTNQMIAQSPSSSCARGATPYRRRQMRAARTKLRFCSHARVVGVAFFDFKHGQTGVAPNAI